MSNEASGPLSDPCEVPIDMVSDNWHSRDIIVFIIHAIMLRRSTAWVHSLVMVARYFAHTDAVHKSHVL